MLSSREGPCFAIIEMTPKIAPINAVPPPIWSRRSTGRPALAAPQTDVRAVGRAKRKETFLILLDSSPKILY